MIEKDYTEAGVITPRRYDDSLEGRNKAEAWIQLGTLTPVAYIEVHPSFKHLSSFGTHSDRRS